MGLRDTVHVFCFQAVNGCTELSRDLSLIWFKPSFTFSLYYYSHLKDFIDKLNDCQSLLLNRIFWLYFFCIFFCFWTNFLRSVLGTICNKSWAQFEVDDLKRYCYCHDSFDFTVLCPEDQSCIMKDQPIEVTRHAWVMSGHAACWVTAVVLVVFFRAYTCVRSVEIHGDICQVLLVHITRGAN